MADGEAIERRPLMTSSAAARITSRSRGDSARRNPGGNWARVPEEGVVLADG